MVQTLAFSFKNMVSVVKKISPPQSKNFPKSRNFSTVKDPKGSLIMDPKGSFIKDLKGSLIKDPKGS